MQENLVLAHLSHILFSLFDFFCLDVLFALPFSFSLVKVSFCALWALTKKQQQHEYAPIKRTCLNSWNIYSLFIYILFVLFCVICFSISCYWPQFFLKPPEFIIQSFISHIQWWGRDKPACYTLKYHHYMLGREGDNELHELFIILM